METIRSRPYFRLAGFTLAEMAVVLLVVGFLSGLVWVVAENLWGNYRFYRYNQQILKTAENIREFYMGAGGLPAGNITKVLDGFPPAGINVPTGIFPADMRRQSAGPGNEIDHPFNNTVAGGSVLVWGSCPGAPTTSSGTPFPCFRFRLLGVPQDACIKMLTFMPINDSALGVIQVGTGLGAGVSATSIPTLNVTSTIGAAQAQTWCVASSEVDFDFKLRN